MNFYIVKYTKEPQSSFKPEDKEAAFINRSCTLRDRKEKHFLEMTKVPSEAWEDPRPKYYQRSHLSHEGLGI